MRPTEEQRFRNLANLLTAIGATPTEDAIPEMLMGADYAVGYNIYRDTWELETIEYDREVA